MKKTGCHINSIPVDMSEIKLHRGHKNHVVKNAEIIVFGVAPPRFIRASSEVTKVHLNAVDESDSLPCYHTM